MSRNKAQNKNDHLVEFSIEEDPFIKAREKGTRRWLLAHIFQGSNKIFIVIVVFTTVISSVFSSLTMVIVGMLINELLLGNISSLIFYTFLVLLLGAGTPLIRILNFMLREVIAQRMERDSRKEFYVNILGKSQSFHDQQKMGDLMARTTDDVRMLNFLISPAVSLIIESFTSLIIPLSLIFFLYPTQLLLAPAGFVIFFIIALYDYVKKVGPVTREMRQYYGEMNAVLNESLSGIMLVKSTVQENIERQKYREKIENYRDAFIEQGYIQAKYIPILLLAIFTTIGLAHSISLYIQGIFNIGQIIAYLGLLSQLRFPTFISFFVFPQIKLASAAAKRLLEVMDKETEIDENIGGITKKIKGNIKFEDVSFVYPGSEKKVLYDLNFEVKAGQTVALVGTTGSGKTTLTKLISRLYDVSEGRILIDGIDIREYALKSLRSQISYIEQDIFLFSNKIMENISFGRVSSLDEIKAVAKKAQAHEFISKLPNGYDSEVGERGVQLSGGEKQRIALARAFLSDPQLLILDDSTSAIDSETEDKIQHAIQNILQDRTTLLITHRLSQIRWADQIILLKRGRIEALGTHEELLKTSNEYRKIFIKKFDIKEEKLVEEVG